VGQSSFSALSHKLAEGQFRVRGRRYLSALPSLPVMRGRKGRFPPHIGQLVQRSESTGLRAESSPPYPWRPDGRFTPGNQKAGLPPC
jgi:hypothetical protein